MVELTDREIVAACLLPGALLAEVRRLPDRNEDDDGPEVQWWQAFRVTDDLGSWHTVIVSDGAVLAVWDDASRRAFALDEYHDWADHRDGDREQRSRELFEGLFDMDRIERTTEGPQNRAWYELEGIDDPDRAAAMLVGLPLCVVEVEGKTGLALTGGGQDFTIEICEGYMRLGYLPPYRFVSQLATVGGRRGTDRDAIVIAGCLRAFDVMAEKVTHQRGLLADWWSRQT